MRTRTVLLSLILLSGCRKDSVTDTEGDSGAGDSQGSGDDADGDGYVEDCDDNNPAIHPDAAEICDGLDNDCNELVDDNAVDATTWFADADSDGFGDVDNAVVACEIPLGFVANDEDCDDTDARFNPGAIESDCEDPLDYNCDGSVGYADVDGDGFAACAECDDADGAVHPDATETCNDVDDDCDGLTDGDDPDLVDALIFYADADGDGYGGSQFEVEECEAPAGYVTNTDDCDDLDPDSYPGAPESCDGADNDCDGDVDEGVGTTWYADADGDGYGDATTTSTQCDAPVGYTWNGDDCNDSDPAAHPGGVEICDGVDNDCDGTADGASALDASDFYADVDGDGYGDSAASTTACSAPSGHVTDDSDCDDTDGAVHPGASETCDSVDNDCDGVVDDGVGTTWYTDADGDGYGGSTPNVACSQPTGTATAADDCNDFNGAVHPGATETCNLVDDDCDGSVDEADASDAATWYADSDGDGYGDPASSQAACSQPVSHVANSGDCDDGASTVNPAAAEVYYDGVDGDCDGASDYDQDGDGDDAVAYGGTDRNDTDASCTTTCRDGLTAASAGITCGTLQAAYPSAGDGSYYLDLNDDGDTSDALQYYCDMTGGGWTYFSVGEPFSFDYTGSSQSLTTVNASTEYLFTVYGAQGGDGHNNVGGKGARAVGSKTFSAATVLTIYVGGAGLSGGTADSDFCGTRTGGFNGGGTGSQGGSGGGGATDVRTSTGSLTGDSTTDPRILVAAGGGGCGGQACYGRGGNGGGLTGEQGQQATPGLTDGLGGSGGTQGAGGTSSYSSNANGGVGQGGNYAQCNDEGGGGGGWYGGAAGGLSNTTGGGGSSYYGGMDSLQSTTEGARSGDGLVEYVFR